MRFIASCHFLNVRNQTICLIFKFLFTPDLACSRAEIVYFVMSCHWFLSAILCSHWLSNENLFIPWWLTQEESNCVTRNSIWVNLDFYTSWDLKDRYFLLVKETFSSDLTCSWIAVSSKSVKDVSKKFLLQQAQWGALKSYKSSFYNPC